MNDKTKKILKIVFSALIAAMTAILAALGLQSCGSTKVSVNKPTNGTYTEIKVTTNNPISTDVAPNVELKNTKENGN